MHHFSLGLLRRRPERSAHDSHGEGAGISVVNDSQAFSPQQSDNDNDCSTEAPFGEREMIRPTLQKSSRHS